MSSNNNNNNNNNAPEGGSPPDRSASANPNNRRSHNNSRGRRNNHSSRESRFEGSCDDLKTAVFDITSLKEETFLNTTRKIAEYVSREYPDAGEYRLAMIDLDLPDLVQPALPADGVDLVQMEVWKMNMRAYEKKVEARHRNSQRIYALVLGQCSPALRSRMEAHDEWRNTDNGSNVIGLLTIIQTCMTLRQTRKHAVHALFESETSVISYRQGRHQSNHKYYEKFKDNVAMAERLRGEIGMQSRRINAILAIEAIDPDNPTDAERTAARLAAKEAYLAICFLMNSDMKRYGGLVRDIENEYTRGTNSYPSSLTEAYDFLVNYKAPRVHNNDQDEGGLAFYNEDGGERTGRDGGGRGHGGRGQGRGGNAGRGQARGAGQEMNRSDHNNGPSGGRSGGRGGANSGRGRGHTSGDGRQIGGSGGAGPQPSGGGGGGEDDHAQYLMENIDNLDTEERGYSLFVDSHPDVAYCFDMFGQTHPRLWESLLLDSCSTLNLICNRNLLHDIHRVKQHMHVRCNAGMTSTNQQGTLGQFPETVWYNPHGAANVLSLFLVQKYFHVQYDNHQDSAFTVTDATGSQLRFAPTTKGLYALCPDNAPQWALVTTVKDKTDVYTKREVQEATRARRVQNIIMYPSTRQYMEITDGNQMRNNPVQRINIKHADDIYGSNLGSLKGKTVHKKGAHVASHITGIPPDIKLKYHQVTLSIDIMFVNTIAFLITTSRGLHFTTIENLLNRQVPTVCDALNKVRHQYARRGFRVNTIHADPEFEPLDGPIREVQFNFCAQGEHVPDIERCIRTVKDRSRCAYNTLPFKRIPRLIIIRMVSNAVFWLNAFPHRDGASSTMSPRTIVLGKHIDFRKHVRLEFGGYAQTHEDHSNDMSSRTLSAICLGPSGNEQGGHYFMSLPTGRRIHRQHWTPLPMPQDVIARVNTLALRQGMPRTLTFADRFGSELHDVEDDADDDHDSTYNPDEDSRPDSDNDDFSYASDSDSDASSTASSNTDTDDDDDPAPPPPDVPHLTLPYTDHTAPRVKITGVNHDNHDNESVDTHETQDEAQDEAQDDMNADEIEDDNDTAHAGNSMTDDNEETDRINNDAMEQAAATPIEIGQNNEQRNRTTGVRARRRNTGVARIPGVAERENEMRTAGVGEPEEEMNQRYGPRRRQGSLRPRKPPSYDHMYKFEDTHVMMTQIEEPLGFLFMSEQMSLKKGLKQFGKDGADAVVSEMEQLDYRDVIRPTHARTLTREQKKASLNYIMYLKQKRCGRIKARGCADGRKQRLYKTKEETSSPTVSTEALFLTSLIDAQERRKVVTVDIPGAFMHSEMDELVHMRLDGPMVDLLVRVNPDKYRDYVTKDYKGNDVIYVILNKALYGTVQASLLFWENLSNFLVDELGFTLNEYDKCVANKLINGKQCTIVWHVDDLKMSHVDQDVLDNIIDRLSEKYGQEAPLTVNRGDVHEYLGMTIDFSVDGKVKFIMKDYIESLLDEAPEDMTGEAATPAANHLFDINAHAEKLSPEQSDRFHQMTAKLLYLGKRARPDIQTAVAFLSTRVSQPDIDDWKKLGRCVRYLRGTKNLILTLESDGSGAVQWWIDASFAVHKDMKSHTGLTMSLGKGSPFSSSLRQKLNTKSSTEAELVGVDDGMSLIVWTRNFLTAQGFNITDNVVYQDNQSAILLERNGRASSGRRTRHVNIRYFFVADRIKNGELRIEYCPTADMWGDFFTKPLQGKAFKRQRAVLLNLPESIPLPITTSGSQECVATRTWSDVVRGTDRKGLNQSEVKFLRGGNSDSENNQ